MDVGDMTFTFRGQGSLLFFKALHDPEPPKSCCTSFINQLDIFPIVRGLDYSSFDTGMGLFWP